MDARIRAIVEECTRASDEDRTTFPEVVESLMEAGVERYHYDLMRGEKVYYMPDGDLHVTPCAPVAEPARAFSEGGVAAAVRAIQNGEIQYQAFRRRICAAGCAGYFVSLVGRRAVYYGRAGDFYIEPFPAAR